MAEAQEKPWFEFWPEGVPQTMEYPEIPLQQVLMDTAARLPEKAAAIFFNRATSFGEINRQSDRLAAYLQRRGLEPGERVALWLPNSPQFPIAFFGVLKAGGVVVPLNPTFKEPEAEHILKDCGARTLIGLDIVYEPIHNVRGNTPVEEVILTNVTEYMPSLLAKLAFLKKAQPRQFPATLRLPDVLASGEGGPAPVEPTPKEDTAVLLYTGGTTGVPKGVMLSHYNLVSNAVMGAECSRMNGDARVLAVLPFFHAYGLTVCLLTPYHVGGTVIMLPQFHKKDTLKAIEKHRPTHFPGVPTLYVALLSHPKIRKYDLSSIQYCVSGAAPLPVEVAHRWREATGSMIVEGYGLTETSPIASANPMDDWDKVRFGSIGIPFPDTEMKVVDLETGEDLPAGEVGEVAIRGPQIMQGYWNKPEETERVLKDGWFFTGDVGKMDEDGYFYIVDRVKDMIIVGGLNVYPRDVEETLFEHEAVELAAVVGIPDDFYGEVPKAFVKLKEGYEGAVTEQALIDFCAERMQKQKVPRAVEIREELPVTIVGKVLRKELRPDEEEE